MQRKLSTTLLVVAILLAGSLATLIIPVPTAAADGGPHGDYSASTDSCAACHRSHVAPGPRLTTVETITELCMSCHGGVGLGAATNVEDGVFLAGQSPEGEGVGNTRDNSPLLGGGFAYYRGKAVTSSHSTDGTLFDAWGNNVNRGETAAISGGLSCISCHNPHGSDNYRILHTEVNSTPVSVAQVDEGAAKDYDTEQWGAGQSQVCAACHGSYHITSEGSGSDPSLKATGGFAHRVDMSYAYTFHGRSNINPETNGLGGYTLPLALTGQPEGDIVTCQTCHLPHGTSVEMTGWAARGDLPGNTSPTDSALLRLDNRGVCQVCHQK